MIAVTSSGKSFRAIARYLAVGRSGQEKDRVAWTASRNLPTNDPELAAKLMRATAEHNRRVEQPVYHLTISFDQSDRVGQTEMERVVDAVLRRLKLEHHQALLVSHRDRAHPHVHVVVNRIHPETGKAWERWQDRPIIEQVLREEERVLGLRQINGRLAPVVGREIPERIGSHEQISSERRIAARSGEVPFIERIRGQLATLRQTTTWNTLETALAQHGLRLEPKGQGFVMTDGTHYVKASRIARDFSRHALEQRFGVSYAERTAAETPLAQVARDIRRYAYITTKAALSLDATVGLEHHRTTINKATERRRQTSVAFDGILAQIYDDPRQARRAFDLAVQQDGAEVAVRNLQHEPERFGSLRIERNSNRLSRYLPTRLAQHWEGRDDPYVRTLAPRVAELGRAAIEASREELRTAERLRDDQSIVDRRAKQLRVELDALPTTVVLERAIAKGLRRLLPEDFRRLETLVTKPQYALAIRIQRTVKDVALGRDEPGREQ